MTLPALVVFSHLRWGFVHQRPQHLLSRLAGRWRVVVIEEPVCTDGPARLEVQVHSGDLVVLVPHTPVRAVGFHDDQLAVLEPLLTRWLEEHDAADAVAWLYTPMALPLVKTMRPRAVVYDCMDELAAFKDAPRQLRQRESALLKRADVVFAGGPSLYEAKCGLNPNVHCIPSSVDGAHFAPPNLRADSEQAARAAALQGHLSGPRVGFFGVIDERLDLSLVAALADAHVDWQLVMVGPIVKIATESLPQRPNIHWLGMQPYPLLPHLLAGWDIALMPFALNEFTRFISPTKTLEYMAGGKPVVSTPVHDVVLLYGNAVEVAAEAGDFIAACERVLAESPASSQQRQQRMRATVAAHSWDRSADSVHREIESAVFRADPVRPARPVLAKLPAASSTPGSAATTGRPEKSPWVAAAGVRL